MTRCPNKFPLWNKETFEKAFKWADKVAACAQAADDVQRQALVASIVANPTCIRFIDDNILQLLVAPVQSLTQAILSSPLLSWLTNARDMLRVTLELAVKRIGERETILLAANVLEKTLVIRINMSKTLHDSQSMNLPNEWDTDTDMDGGGGGERKRPRTTIVTQQQLQHAHPYQNTGLSIDEKTLALELLLGLCLKQRSIQGKEKADAAASGAESDMAETFEIIQGVMQTDLVSLRLLLIALGYTPAAVAVGLCAMSTSLSSSSSPSASASSMSTNFPPWQEVYSLTTHTSLWSIVNGCVRENFLRFVLADKDHTLCEVLCAKNVQFGKLYFESLVELASNLPLPAVPLIPSILKAVISYLCSSSTTHNEQDWQKLEKSKNTLVKSFEDSQKA